MYSIFKKKKQDEKLEHEAAMIRKYALKDSAARKDNRTTLIYGKNTDQMLRSSKQRSTKGERTASPYTAVEEQ
jgi:hypothetical protein